MLSLNSAFTRLSFCQMVAPYLSTSLTIVFVVVIFYTIIFVVFYMISFAVEVFYPIVFLDAVFHPIVFIVEVRTPELPSLQYVLSTGVLHKRSSATAGR